MQLSWMGCAVMLSVAGASAEAGPAASYHFMEEGSGDILATMDLAGPGPYEHTDITDFSFTAEGDAIFGLGVGSFPEPFASTTNGMFEDIDGKLVTPSGGVVFVSTDFQDFIGGPQVDYVQSTFGFSDSPSRITLGIDSNDQVIEARGLWMVPAPGAAALLGLAAVGALRRRR